MFKYCFEFSFHFLKKVDFKKFESLINLKVDHIFDDDDDRYYLYSTLSKEYNSTKDVYIDESLEKYLKKAVPHIQKAMDYINQHQGEISLNILIDDSIEDLNNNVFPNFPFFGYALTKESIKLLASINASVDCDSYLATFTSEERRHLIHRNDDE